VDLLGSQVGRRLALDRQGVARRAVGQRPDPRVGPPARRVLVAHELGEGGVGREDGVAQDAVELARQPLALGGGDGVRETGERAAEGGRLGRRVGDPLCLRRHLLEQELGRHEALGHPGPHVRHGVVEHLRQLLEPGDPVLVVLDRLEGKIGRERRRLQVDAAHLVDREHQQDPGHHLHQEEEERHAAEVVEGHVAVHRHRLAGGQFARRGQREPVVEPGGEAGAGGVHALRPFAPPAPAAARRPSPPGGPGRRRAGAAAGRRRCGRSGRTARCGSCTR
jgi:hypothetical protein